MLKGRDTMHDYYFNVHDTESTWNRSSVNSGDGSTLHYARLDLVVEEALN